MKKGAKKGISQIFNQKKVKIYVLLFAVIFFLFVFLTSDSPKYLGTKILFSCFFTIFSLINLINMRFWIKVLISVIISPFFFLLFFGISLIGGMTLSSFVLFGGLDDRCNVDSDCIPANELHCLYRVCNENCENQTVMPAFNKNSKIPDNLDCNSPFGGTYYLPQEVSCMKNKCVSS